MSARSLPRIFTERTCTFSGVQGTFSDIGGTFSDVAAFIVFVKLYSIVTNGRCWRSDR